MTTKNIAPILAGLLIAIGAGVLVAHAVDTSYAPLAPLPGTYTTDTAGVKTTTMSDYLSGMITLLIALGAATAILFAIIGGTQYVASGIAPSAKQDAKNRITNAFIGLALMLTSYLILNSINPELVDLKFSLPPVQGQVATTTAALGACPIPNDSSAACCLGQGTSCAACSNCSEVTGVPYKSCGRPICFLNSALLGRIRRISGVSGWQITESWPPTVYHQSSCHQNGTCADLNNSGGPTDPTTIKKYYDAFKDAGLNVLYESKDCTSYIAAGVTNCQSYPTMTNASSFHVKL